MNILKLLRDIINFLYIFFIVNDNFIVDIFGEFALKIMFVIFFVINIMSLFKFNYRLKVNKRFILLILILLFSYAFNLKNYSDIQQPLMSLLSVIMIYVVTSTYDRPKILMGVFLISVFFSSLICITSDTTLTDYTFRKTGGTGDPNEFSMMVLISISYLVGTFRIRTPLLKRVLQIVVILIYFVALFMAGSKSAMLTLVVLALSYYIMLLNKKTFKKKMKNTVLYVVLFGGIFGVLWTINREVLFNVLERFENNSSAGERLLSWGAGLELWLKSPFLGIGPQNYANMIAEYFPYIAETSRVAHNIFIQIFVEAGVFGLIAFMVFIATPIKNSFRRIIPIEYILGFISILVMGMTLAAFFEKYVWLYFGIICNSNVSQYMIKRR